jgi:hypothetical protein
MKSINTMIIVVCFLLCNTTLADPAHDQLVHDTAHFGASYSLSMFTYGFTHKVLGMTKNESFIFSALSTLAIGFMYKAMMASDLPPERGIPGLGRAMLMNGVGIGAMGVTVAAFDF